MKKVAIFTLNGYFNYGNRLQNYALQEVIKSLGFNVETVINNNKEMRQKKNKGKSSNLKRIQELGLKELLMKSCRKVENFLYKNRLNEKRYEIFKGFSNKYISETNYSVSDNNIPKALSKSYDYFVTGSDQVWNPYLRKGSFIDFLTFAPMEKRISYAASFAISEIPEDYIENYKKWISEMRFLAVREEAGAKIIRQLTNREALVVVDPTMLLSKEQWLSISKEHTDKPKSKYILTYFLGEIPKRRKRVLEEIASRNNLEIVNLAQITNSKTYLTGPSEFLDYINSATVFCTDSFHGALFSILFERPFVVFNRADNQTSMNSRFETLLSTFELESRHIDNINSNSDIFNIDYTHVPSILEREQKKAFNYLKVALNIDK